MYDFYDSVITILCLNKCISTLYIKRQNIEKMLSSEMELCRRTMSVRPDKKL